MKYMKKALAAVSAVLICVSSAVPFTASAEADLVSKCNDALDKIVASWDRDTIVQYLSKAYDRALLAYNNGQGNYYDQIYLGTTIVPRNAETFSADALNEKIAPYKVENKDGKYVINITDPADKEKVYTELKLSNEIVSVSEDFKVLKAGFWKINNIQVSTKLTQDELTGAFNALNLKLVAETDEDFSSATVYKYIYKLTDPIGLNISKAQFEAIRELMKKECYLDIDYSAGTSEEDTKYISVSIFGDSDVLYGDVDENGVVDMNDLTLLSQYVIGDVENFTEDQIKKADVVKDGSVNLADVTTLKQYVMKDKVVLGK